MEDTRQAADQVALANCRKFEGPGLDSYTQEMREAVKDSCNVIFRFGPDYPGARESVTVIHNK